MKSSFKGSFFAFVFLLSLVACGGSGGGIDLGESSVTNPPRVLGISESSISMGVSEDISINYTSQGNDTSFTTTIISAPTDSQMMSQTFQGESFGIVLDQLGTYRLSISISDSIGSTVTEFDLESHNDDPVAVITGAAKSNIYSNLTLSSINSSDINGQQLTYQWRLVSKPETSVLADEQWTGDRLTAIPDVMGDYVFEVTALDGAGGTNSAEFSVEITSFKTRRLSFNVVDASYLRDSNLLILLGDDNHLYSYSLDSHEERSISLGMSGATLAVSELEQKAVVGHDGFITYIDLSSWSVLERFDVTTDVFDIEIANGFAYAMPRIDQWENVRTINLESGAESLSTGGSVRAGSKTKLHPSQNYIYAADNGSSPSDIEKYDITNGNLEVMYDSPYHGDYSMCGDLWISEEGSRIFTACGNVFHSTTNQQDDMTFNGELQLTGMLTSLAHLDNSVVYLDDDNLGQIHYSDFDVMNYRNAEELGVYTTMVEHFDTAGDLVFYQANGAPIVISTIASESLLEHTSAVQYQPQALEGENVLPIAVANSKYFGLINQRVTILGDASFDSDGQIISFSWILLDKPENSSANLTNSNAANVLFTPDLKGSYTLQLTVSDGISNSVPKTVTVLAEDPADRIVKSLDFQVVDSEYSETLDKVVLLNGSDDELVLYTPSTDSFEVIALEFSAEVLSLNSAGTKAMVGTTNQVALLDLESLTVEKTFVPNTDLVDIVLADNGYAYLFPKTDQHTRFRALNLDTGLTTEHTGNTIYAGTKAKLHPSGDYIYGADNGLSPSDLELYDISGGEAVYLTDSPYHGDFDICGDLWISDNGARAFTKCGNVFKTSPENANDMTYAGSLDVSNQLLSVSNFDNEIIALMENESHGVGTVDDGSVYIQFFNFDTLNFERKLDLPQLTIGSELYSNLGRNVFHNSDGEQVIVLMQTEPDAEVLNDYSLFILNK